MSKLTKFLKNPYAYFSDAYRIQKSTRGKKKIYVVGFSTWKTYLRKYFSEYDLVFIPKNIEEKKFNSDFKNKILINKKNCQLFVWGLKAPDFIFKFAEKNKIPVRYVEDGFVRSVKLGAEKVPPMSLSLDSVAPYFDAGKPTELETLLNNFNPSEEPELIKRAKNCIQLMVSHGISKYNHGLKKDVVKIYGEKKSKRVLVVGQVEDDASIVKGCKSAISNTELVMIAAKENPNAQIIYKPHPDVLQNHRERGSNPEDVKDICKIIKEDLHLSSALETIDHVYTITSLAGFEALLRGIKVTTIGAPFYSGWGLTDDRQSVSRRAKNLKVEDVFAVSYIKYARYFDPDTGTAISLEDVINRISSEIGNNVAPVVDSQNDKLSSKKVLKERKIYFDEAAFTNPFMKRHVEKVFTSKEVGCEIVFGQFRLQPFEAVVRLGSEVAKVYVDENIFLPGASLPVKGNALITAESCEDSAFDSFFHFANVVHYKITDDFLSLYRHYQFSDRASLKSLTVYALKAGIYSDKILNDTVYLVKNDFGSLSLQDKQLVLNKLHRVYGVNGPMESVLPIYSRNAKNVNPVTLVRLVTILCEAGEYSEAINLYKKTNETHAAHWAGKRFMGLNAILFRAGVRNDSIAERDNYLFEWVQKCQFEFENYCIENDVAVVGNSPCEIGLRKGKLIDERDKVIRFNSANIDYPRSEDYGRKTNVVVANPRYFETDRNVKSKLDYAILSDGCVFTTNNISLKVEDYIGFSDKVTFIPKRIDSALVEKLEASPSSGLKILYWIYSARGVIRSADTYGFSMVDQRYGMATSYATSKTKVLSTIHDWNAEAIIFSEIVQK